MTDPVQSATMMRVSQEVAGLRAEIGTLTQGLVMMAEAEQTQAEMLRQILDAMQPPPDDGENPMADAMREISVALRELRTAQEITQREVTRCAERMAGAILRGARINADADV